MTELEQLELMLRRVRAETKCKQMSAIELVDVLIEYLTKTNNSKSTTQPKETA